MKPLYVAILAISIYGSLGINTFAQGFIDDFDSGDINDRWLVQRNAVGSVEIAQEDGHGIVTATTGNANGGLASIASFDPLSDGIYVKFVISEVVGNPNANGFLVGIVDDNSVFHRNTNNFGIAAFGQEARTFSSGGFSLIAGDQNAGGESDWILDEGEDVDRASFEDGFTVTLTADVTGWSYLIEGLQDIDGMDQVYENMGTWADAGATYDEIFGQDNEWHVLTADQSPGEKITRFDQISLGNPKSASDPDIRVSSSFDVGQLPSVPELHERTLGIRNAGEAQMLEITGIEISGADADHFSVEADQFPLMIAPGEAGEVLFTVNSLGETGGFQAVFTLANNDPAPDGDSRLEVVVSASVINLNGPTAHYPMDETSGTEMRDVTGLGRAGTYGESVVLGEAGLAGGSAMRVTGGAKAMLNGRKFDEGTFDEFSVSLWFQADDVAPTGTLIANGLDNNPVFALLVNAGELNWFVDANSDFVTTGAGLEASTAHHAVVTYSTDETIIYVDGERKGDGITAIPALDGSEQITIGAFGPLGFSGSIDDIQIYKRVISPNDVQFLLANPGTELGTTGPIDSDGDGLTDEDEVNIHLTEPLIADTDGDSLSDGVEVNDTNTDPLMLDSDGGGAWDGFEVAQGTDPTLKSDDPGVWSVRTLKARGGLNNLEEADALIEEATFSSEVLNQHTLINFLGSGAAFGNFGNDMPFDNIEAIGDPVDGFAVVAATTIFINEAGTYSFGFNSDDGGRLSVDGVEVVSFPGTRGPNDSLGSLTLSLGLHTVEVVMFERSGGSALEVFWTPEPGDATEGFDSDRHQLLTATSVKQIDSDNDNLDDNWERAHFNDLSKDGSADSDSDGLTDLAEHDQRTDPNATDTDGDGVDDGPEVNMHSTSPLNADTDGDLRTDGEEINGDPKSNPLEQDSDGDTYRDGFEVTQNSDPNDASSLPEDRLGEPNESWHTLQTLPTFNGGADTSDVTFRVFIDFDASSATEEEREMIWESGGGTIGFSIVYESGNRLVLRAVGDGGNTVATVDHTLTAEQLAAGSVPVIWTFDVDNGDPAAAQTIALYLDGELVGEDSKAMSPDWTGSDGASFGIGTASFAAGGENTVLNNGIDFASGTIDLDAGLQMFIGKLFAPGGDGNPEPSDSNVYISSITHTSDTVILNVVGADADALGDVEYSPNLALDSWAVILSDAPLDAPITDSDAARTEEAKGFYRLRTP